MPIVFLLLPQGGSKIIFAEIVREKCKKYTGFRFRFQKSIVQMQRLRKLRREDKIDSSILIDIVSFSTMKKATDNMLHLQVLPLLDPLVRDIALKKEEVD